MNKNAVTKTPQSNPSAAKQENPWECVLEYHQLSKHQPGKYALGPDSLDWDLQPSPFRHFEGAAKIPLPLSAKQLKQSFKELKEELKEELNNVYAECTNARPVDAKSLNTNPLDITRLGQLLETSMGLSAWKTYAGDKWSLRCNPSSGNLHPTETYLITGSITGLDAGVYHYQAHDHCLELRCDLSSNESAVASFLANGSFLIGFSSVHWREAWKYGVRAYRYCQLDIGHAIAAIRYAAALQGWRVTQLDQFTNSQIGKLLGIDRKQDFGQAEPEHPDLLLLLETEPATPVEPMDSQTLCSIVDDANWYGTANVLSPEGRLRWPQIERVTQACAKTEDSPSVRPPANIELPNFEAWSYQPHNTASELFRQRRSAQAFDGQSQLTTANFYQMLAAITPQRLALPIDYQQQLVYIHPIFYIHRVEGLEAGLYAMPRSESGSALLKKHFRDEFEWQKPSSCPSDIAFYRLVKANCRKAAKSFSCHQDIASDSTFAMSMLAEFEPVVQQAAWRYRHLYYEAGMLGQILYIEAEAIGYRATGIGCFLDDVIHQTLGISDLSLQCLYNFTVGVPQLDTRLVSLPPYSHLSERTS